MKVAIDTFARAGIEARLGSDLAAGVRTALRHYTQRLRVGTDLPDLPRFRRGESSAYTGAELELAVDPRIQEALEREAQGRQGVSPAQLAGHAVLVYLADLDKEAPEPAPRPLALL